MSRSRATLTWVGLAVAVIVPIGAAAMSPLLAWREPIYIIAGFAGIAGLALLLVQPLLAGGYLPGLPGQSGRRMHRWVGIALVAMLVIHVGGLWITSPPDVIDALLFVSPTPFSAWGVVAMWAVFGAALLALFRRKLRLSPHSWRFGHTALVVTAVVGTVVHAMLIEGTMETFTKAALCALVLLATAKVVGDLRVWSRGRSRR